MKTAALTLCLLLSACTVKTEIIRSGDSYVIKSKRNALVVVKDKKTGEQFMVDNRNQWYLEMLLSNTLVKTDKSVHVELDDLDAVKDD